MRKIAILLGLFMTAVFSADLHAQKLTVKGKVSDSVGIPLIAVTVYEDGNTANGTVTDFDGN